MGALPPWKPFEVCRPELLAHLESLVEPLTFSPGQRVIEAGAPATGLLLITEGVVRVFHSRDGEAQFTVKLLRAPNAVGLVEALRDTPWVASVEALTPLSAARLPAVALRDAVRSDNALANALLEDVTAKFEQTIRGYRAMGFDSCDTRLMRVLLEYAEHFGRPDDHGLVIRFPLPRERLAREIGAARRSVDRALEKLAKEGLVALSPKGWQVLRDPEALRARVLNASAEPETPSGAD